MTSTGCVVLCTATERQLYELRAADNKIIQQCFVSEPVVTGGKQLQP